MMLREGQSLEALGVMPGAAFAFPAVAPLLGIRPPWALGTAVLIPLTGDQQVEMACSDGVLLPLLCWGPEGVHTHNVFLALHTNAN